MPILAAALVLREIPLSDVVGMVARGEAVGSEEGLAKILAATDLSTAVADPAAPAAGPHTDRDDDAREAPLPA